MEYKAQLKKKEKEIQVQKLISLYKNALYLRTKKMNKTYEN